MAIPLQYLHDVSKEGYGLFIALKLVEVMATIVYIFTEFDHLFERDSFCSGSILSNGIAGNSKIFCRGTLNYFTTRAPWIPS
jgi:hypothetical protein